MNKTKGLVGIAITFVNGFLGAWAGADQTSKNWRRICVPGTIASYAYWLTQNLWTVTIMAMSAVVSMGYGVPDATDEGSDLGRFWYKIFKGNELLTNIFTRGTIGLLESICLISIPILYGNWEAYGYNSLGIIITNATISWRNLGTFKLFGKELLWSEALTYLCVTAFAFYIIISAGV